MEYINYKLSEVDSKRLEIMKLLLAVFVVYIHIHQFNVNIGAPVNNIELPMLFDYFTYAISEGISRCSVGGFFLISSMLLYRKNFSWKTNMKKKCVLFYFHIS